MDDLELDSFTPVSHLKGNLNLNELVNSGTIFEINNEDHLYLDNDSEGEGELLSHNIIDDDDDEESEESGDETLSQFEKLALKMFNVDENGYVKKRIIQEGNGEIIPDGNALVTVHYDSFLEYSLEPFDSTRNRKPPSYRLNAGVLIPGFEIAIKSMQNREIAQFLIRPEYAYGELGLIQKVPANSTILYKVEILKVLDSISADFYEQLSIEERKKFQSILRLAETHQNEAKTKVNRKDYKGAIQKYNQAIHLLVNAQLADMSEQEKQERTLLKLYTNIAICYNATDSPKKACTAFNHLKRLTLNKTLQIPAKAYFSHYRSLFKLGEYENAKRELLKAKEIEPTNREILNELCKLQQIIDNYRTEEQNRAKTMMSDVIEPSQKVTIIDVTNVNSKFVETIKEFINKFITSSDQLQEIPDKLSTEEIEVVRTEAESKNLEFVAKIMGDKQIYYIKKKA